MDSQNIWSTNPLFLTSRESALSDAGVEQIERACEKIREEKGLVITTVRYSLAANCMDSANIIGRELKIGRDRLLPEYTFLDPRAVGYWDMSPRNTTEAAVWAMDVDEAGPYGSEARPPANDDGTPNETLEDQATRLRQLISGEIFVLQTLHHRQLFIYEMFLTENLKQQYEHTLNNAFSARNPLFRRQHPSCFS